MVYKFKLVNDEVSHFSREIEIDPDASFFELRNAILDSVGYSKDEIDSFYICDEDWSRGEEVTLEDMGSSSDQDIWLMADTPISQLVEDEGQRLIFTFDYLTERSFFMELKEVITGRTCSSPVCTRKEGNPPEQRVDLDEFEKQLDVKAASFIEDMDFEADSELGYNDDELPEGFEDFGSL